MMEPAQTVIERLGGATKVAGIVGIHRTRVSNWRRPKEKGGTDGAIPQRHHRALLDYALSNSIELKAEDFLAASEAPAIADDAQTEHEPEGAR